MTMATNYPTLEQVVRELSELRPLSPAARSIIEIAEDERFSAHELAAGIASDPVLTAKMLRLANSAYYGFPRRITTVRDAVVLLGFRTVRSTTLATCLIDAMPGSNSLDYERFWRFSVSTGMVAELLARSSGLPPEEAFTAGVLHNIGRLALDQQVPRGFEQSVQHALLQRIGLHEAERDVLGYDDAELGAALCERWSFPPSLIEAVGHYMLDASALPDATSLAAAVLRARMFVRAAGLDDGVEVASAEPAAAEWSAPPLSVALDQAGGMDGLLDRVAAFLDSAVGA